MDSFHEPRRAPEPIHIEQVRASVRAHEDEHRAKGIPLSGRVIHVCHYLPITATLHSSSKPAILSPPATPPPQASDIPPSPSDENNHGAVGEQEGRPKPKWGLGARQGHAAMISGIKSLSATHEQVIVGWTGDIESPISNAGTFIVWDGKDSEDLAWVARCGRT